MNDDIRNVIDAAQKRLTALNARTQRGIDFADSTVPGLTQRLGALVEELERQAKEFEEIGRRESIKTLIDDRARFDDMTVPGELGDLTIVTRATTEPEALVTFRTVIDGNTVRVSTRTTVKALQKVARALISAHGDRTQPPKPEPQAFEGLKFRTLNGSNND